MVTGYSSRGKLTHAMSLHNFSFCKTKIRKITYQLTELSWRRKRHQGEESVVNGNHTSVSDVVICRGNGPTCPQTLFEEFAGELIALSILCLACTSSKVTGWHF